MSNSIEYLSACTSPVPTAKVFNPTRSEYYLKDDVIAAQKAAQKAKEQAPPNGAVKVTLSSEAQAALKQTALPQAVTAAKPATAPAQTQSTQPSPNRAS